MKKNGKLELKLEPLLLEFGDVDVSLKFLCDFIYLDYTYSRNFHFHDSAFRKLRTITGGNFFKNFDIKLKKKNTQLELENLSIGKSK